MIAPAPQLADLQGLLVGLRLGHLLPVFVREEIDMETLPFLGSEDLAENYRALQRVRKGDSHKALIDEEGPIAVLQSVRGVWQKSLRNMEADLFTHG